MKTTPFIPLLFLLLLFGPQPAFAVYPAPADAVVEVSPQNQKTAGRWEKRKARWEKRIAKWKAKRSGIWDQGNFRIGVVLLLAAIGVGILAGLGLLRGLLGFIAGLLAFAGIVLIVWALIEYYG